MLGGHPSNYIILNSRERLFLIKPTCDNKKTWLGLGLLEILYSERERVGEREKGLTWVGLGIQQYREICIHHSFLYSNSERETGRERGGFDLVGLGIQQYREICRHHSLI